MNESKTQSLSGQKLVDEIIESLQQKLAEEIVIVEMPEARGGADFFIVCQGDNTSHTSAIAEGVTKNLKEKHTIPWHAEGSDDGRWILIDYTDVVVHVMLPEIREYYDLESLWADGNFTRISSRH
ncbi:MAG: ribosome silencing factor [Chitinispirillaceae bacterium]